MRFLFAIMIFLVGGSMAGADDENTLFIEIDGQTNGRIVIELLPELAPNHVERIKSLAHGGHYDGVVFHRVIDGFMAQTGDVQYGVMGSQAMRYAGMGGSTQENLAAEFSSEPFVRGTVGMARARDPDSANSQFFIMFDEVASLNGQYTVFGRVIDGLDVLDAVKLGDSARNGTVIDPDYMSRVWVGPIPANR